MFRNRTAPAPEATATATATEDRMHVPDELRPFYVVDRISESRRWSDKDDTDLAQALIRARLSADPDAWEQTKRRRYKSAEQADSTADLGIRPRRSVGASRDRAGSALDVMLSAGPEHYRPDWDEIDAEAAHFAPEDVEWWMHCKRLDRARKAKAEHDHRATVAATTARVETCELCGTRDRASVRPRRLDHETGRLEPVRAVTAQHDVLACGPCAVVIEAEMLHAYRLERVADGTRTRVAAAAEWLTHRGN